jgi:nucleotide-binding universal stress UspA family protein
MLRSILVPLDGSTFGEHALPIAASLARRAGATLHLAHVHHAAAATPAGIAPLDASDLHSRQDEQAYLADAARRVADKAPLDVKTALLAGGVVASLKDFATREAIALVVMSTHGRGVLGRFWLGSVADDLAHELACPLLLVRPHEGKPDLHREAVLKSIVVPLDGAPLAERAVEPALELGKLFDAQLTLVRVNEPVIQLNVGPMGEVGPLPLSREQANDLERREADTARDYLDGLAAKLTAGGARVRTHVVTQQRPAAGILAEADATHADLIAIETHGRRGLARLLLGSVADKVVRRGAVPVLLHRAAR